MAIGIAPLVPRVDKGASRAGDAPETSLMALLSMPRSRARSWCHLDIVIAKLSQRGHDIAAPSMRPAQERLDDVGAWALREGYAVGMPHSRRSSDAQSQAPEGKAPPLVWLHSFSFQSQSRVVGRTPRERRVQPGDSQLPLGGQARRLP